MVSRPRQRSGPDCESLGNELHQFMHGGVKDEELQQVLHEAKKMGCLTVCCGQYKKHKSVCCKDDDCAPLTMAVKENYVKLIECMIKLGFNPNAVLPGTNGETLVYHLLPRQSTCY